MATISEALAMAIQHHRAGRLQAAEQIYRQILQAEPNHADAIHLLGVIAHQAGKHRIAVEYIGRAIGLNRTEAAYHNNLGEAYRALRRVPEAVACYRRALELKPDYAEAHNNLDAALNDRRKLDEAVAWCRRALETRPDCAEAHYNLGVAFKDQGNLDEAVACWRRALELKPDFAEGRNNLAVALKDQGKLDEAIACYRRAVELKPDYAAAHYNLGNAFMDQGKLDEALACYRRAVELKPDFAAAHYNLGNALKGRGKLDGAVACYRRALELKPDYPEAHGNLGNALKDRGRLDEAVACYRRAVELKPDYAEAHSNLGVALKDLGKLDEALACQCRALELKPDYVEAHSNLGNALKDLGKLDEALACQRRALELKSDYVEAHNNLGAVLEEQGKLDESLACYRRAVELKPDFAEAHSNLGSVLEEIGDLQGAEDCFRAALRHNSRFAFAHYQLAAFLGGKLPQQDLAAQRRLLEEMELTDAQRLLLHFGLAQVLDARGEYAEVAEHLDRGNAMQLSEWRNRGKEYDPKEYELLITRMIEISTPDFFQRVRGFGLESELPVFVVGLPRSGTTLIEQILASHGQVFGAGEIKLVRDTMAALGGQGADPIEGLRRLDRETAHRLASRHLEKLRAFSREALRVVDKMPDNYLYLGPLASLFPRAKLIHCRRDLRDVAVSCWMTHFKEIPWANDQQHIASRFHEYQRVMEHWRQVLPAPLLEVDYEETVADLEGVARKLVAWCGLAWEPACLEFHQAKRPVRTASAVQVRQPVFRTSVGRWKHYEQALDWLFARLEGVDVRKREGRPYS
jgi:tetratricopeptide (TPR) repeat protein